MNKIVSLCFILLFGLGTFCSSVNKADNLSDDRIMNETSNCIKCNIEYAKDIVLNIDSVKDEQISLFLCSFDSRCSNNVEYYEFSNEVLFLLLSNYTSRTIKLINEEKNLDLIEIHNAIQNPIADNIDLQELYDKVEEVDTKSFKETKMTVLNSIKIAMGKLE